MKKLVVFALIGLAMIMLVACAPAALPTTAPTPQPTSAPAPPTAAPAQPSAAPTAKATTAAPKKGGIIRLGTSSDFQGFDPHLNIDPWSIELALMLYNPLLEMDAGKFKPALAESWETSPDGFTYTFKLRKGVKFHSGQEFTAVDAQFSLSRVMDKKSPLASIFATIKSVEVVDPYQIKVVLNNPFSAFLGYLGSVFMVPKATVEKQGDLKSTPDGTGPFRLKERVPSQVTRLERNPNYFQAGLPYLDGVEVRIISDDSARMNAMRAGEIDRNVWVPVKEVEALKKDTKWAVVSGPSTVTQYVGMNLSRKPFNNLKVRQAISSLVDRQAIVDVAAFGQGVPTVGGPVPAILGAYYGEVPYKLDVAKAKQLLTDAGYPDGLKTTITVQSTDKLAINIAQILQSQFKPAGIAAEIKPLEIGGLMQALTTLDYDMYVLGYGGPIMDPDVFVSPWVTGGRLGERIGYSDPVFDDLVARGRATLDTKARDGFYRDAQKRMAEQAAVVFLYLTLMSEAQTSYVKGYATVASDRRSNYAEVWMDK